MASQAPGILAELSAWQCGIRPDAVATLAQNSAITYRELDERGNRVAQGLIAAGCEPGSRVAIIGKNSNAYLEILVGAMKARAVLTTVNWRLAEPEIVYILKHGETQLLFVDQEFTGVARAAAAQIPDLEVKIAIGAGTDGFERYATWRDAQPAKSPGLTHEPDDVVVQMYTSGTTGLPKGVQLTNRNYDRSMALSSQLPWQDYAPDNIFFAPAPYFHVNGLNAVIRSLQVGSKLLTIDQFNPAEVVNMFEREKVTRAGMAPAMIQMCLDVPGIEARDFSRLRTITYGGSPISQRVLTRAREVFGCRFVQGYGMTEATGPVAMLAPEDHEPARGKLMSCGRPLPGIEVKVVDASGMACPPHGIGEVVVRGPIVTKGYWRDEKATTGAIVDGWLHTGDAAYFDEDGYLYIYDRIKEMIVSGAENIYPAEVENALFHHPDVADVAVIGVPDEKWGEAVKALVVPKPGATLSGAELIAYARAHIAGYKVPKSVEFVTSIPRNAAGKILRRDLRKPYWENQERKVN